MPGYTTALNADGLRSKRLGVPRKFSNGVDAVVVAAFNTSLETMKAPGTTIFDPAGFPDFDETAVSKNQSTVLSTDFKVCLSISYSWHDMSEDRRVLSPGLGLDSGRST